MDQETFYGVEVGGGPLKQPLARGQGHDLILSESASNGRHTPDVSAACSLLWTLPVLGAIILGYLSPSLGLHPIQCGQWYF